MVQVFATAVAASVSSMGNNPARRDVAKFIESAMAAAVAKCGAEGITDPEAVREHMMAAREAARETLRKGGLPS